MAAMNLHGPRKSEAGQTLIDAAAALLLPGAATFPAISARAVRARRARRPCALQPRRACRHRRAPGPSSSTTRPARQRSRFARRMAERSTAVLEDRQRRHAVPGRLGAGRAGRARRRCPASWCIRSFGRARRRGQARRPSRRARQRRRRSAKASSTSISAASTTRTRAPPSCARSSACSPTCASAVQDWRPMLARVGEVVAELKANPPPLPPTRSPRRSQFLEWLVGRQFHLPRAPANTTYADTDDMLEPRARDRARAFALTATCECCAAAPSSS